MFSTMYMGCDWAVRFICLLVYNVQGIWLSSEVHMFAAMYKGCDWAVRFICLLVYNVQGMWLRNEVHMFASIQCTRDMIEKWGSYVC